ncbi:hypothetical protein RAA17_12640 [Komagataeibacter rhaeticus]|nr:hypothetical protein [Komagataeibacter rhaeticus]
MAACIRKVSHLFRPDCCVLAICKVNAAGTFAISDRLPVLLQRWIWKRRDGKAGQICNKLPYLFQQGFGGLYFISMLNFYINKIYYLILYQLILYLLQE